MVTLITSEISVPSVAKVLLALACILGNSLPCSAQAPAKKFIEWSAVEPSVDYLVMHPEEIQTLPFDGFVFRITTPAGEQMMWEMWGKRQWTEAEFEQCVEKMRSIDFGQLTDRFLRVNVTPGDVDWLNDRAFAVVVENFRVAAKLAKRMGCKGILFDNEQYVTRLFDSEAVAKTSKASREYIDCMVRQRGCEWMRAINKEFPDITILMTFGYRAAKAEDDPKFCVGNYALLAPFLDGALTASDPRTRFIDGWEYSYGYKEKQQFAEARDVIKRQSLCWTTCPSKYQRQFKAALAVWTDYELKGTEWSQVDFSKNFHTPEQFEQRLRFAQDCSDEYVWIYSGRPNWWTGKQLPVEYIHALQRVRNE